VTPPINYLRNENVTGFAFLVNNYRDLSATTVYRDLSTTFQYVITIKSQDYLTKPLHIVY